MRKNIEYPEILHFFAFQSPPQTEKAIGSNPVSHAITHTKNKHTYLLHPVLSKFQTPQSLKLNERVMVSHREGNYEKVSI
jgi:hypothetical protein